MNLLADENIDPLLVNWLRERGHHVASIAEDEAGSSDVEVLELAWRSSRCLITQDLDFGVLVQSEGYHCHGLLILRLPKL